MPKTFAAALIAVTSASIILTTASVAAATETVLYTFCSRHHCSDGESPLAGLLNVNGMLYGTTATGGGKYDTGTLFSIDPQTGIESVLYSFKHGYNAQDPEAPLIALNGVFYGTTAQGGKNGFGTVFSFDPATGVETVLHSFDPYSSDGIYPDSALVDVNGVLYGVTYQGGVHGAGDIFAIHPKSGKEKVVYSFPGSNSDGLSPTGALLNMNGVLYGTTTAGGANSQGVVFSFDPGTGAEKVLYTFCALKGCADGAAPLGDLIAYNGILYGVTSSGGAYNNGAVFAINPVSGAGTVVYSFCAQTNCTDGAGPSAGLLEVGGTLYGTTRGGGANGNGTVFALDPATGSETVLYAFQDNGTDGSWANGGLVHVGKKLYGTTYLGGSSGGGTVFEVRR